MKILRAGFMRGTRVPVMRPRAAVGLALIARPLMPSAGLSQVGNNTVRDLKRKLRGHIAGAWHNYWASRNDSSRENRIGSRLRRGLLGCSRSFMHSRFILISACT